MMEEIDSFQMVLTAENGLDQMRFRFCQCHVCDPDARVRVIGLYCSGAQIFLFHLHQPEWETA